MLHEKNLENIRMDSVNQLRHIDFALSIIMKEVKQDVSELLMHEHVTDFNDSGFTSFLNASADTFQYHISPREARIIDDLNAFRLTHPYVNSVYVGRESGAFIRSHPRPLPTRYDPRTRPWYILGKNHPDTVMITEPYQSVTSPDINIGIVKAMTFPNGSVYGVLGADITLINLTEYISSIKLGRSGEIMLVNETGIILATKDPENSFSDIRNFLGDKTDYLLGNSEGIITLPSSYLIFYTSPMLGWKFLIIIPYSHIEQEITESVIIILLFVFFALILLSIITLVILDQTIIRPLSTLTDITKKITRTGDLNQNIKIHVKGEVGDLADAITSMIAKIQEQETLKNHAFTELSSYRDRLEELVRERTVQLEISNKDLIRERDRAEAADKLKSAFLATMSHELRTPLNSIIGFTGIILQGLTGPLNEEQNKQLTMVQQSARHLLALINDVLDISKIEAGELKITREPVKIQNIIQNVISTLNKSAEDKGLKIVTDIALKPMDVFGDSRRIEQILINLVNNAIKFTEQGTITVKCFMKGNMIEISVLDTGIGIEKEQMDKLFQPFHQIDTGTARKHEGTGLGLSITKKLVELHEGTISVSSNPGKGSEFTVTLPAMEKTS